MTIISKEVTRHEEQKKIVQTCDVCELSEIELPDDESIDTICAIESRNLTYEIDIQPLEDEHTDGWAETFDEYTDEAMERLMELDMDTHTVEKRTRVETEWSLHIDACENCQKMLFGATRDFLEPETV